MAERTAADYWRQVRSLPILKKGNSLIVDWGSVFPGSLELSALYVLGFDPLGEGTNTEKWVDVDAQYKPMPDWANKPVVDRVGLLEDRISALEKK